MTRPNALVLMLALASGWAHCEASDLVNNTLVDELPLGGDHLEVYPGAGRVVLRDNLPGGNAKLEHDMKSERAANFAALPSTGPLSPGPLQRVAP